MRIMRNRRFKNKYVSVFSLVAFLFATTCLIPCGGFELTKAEAGVHHDSGDKAAGHVMAKMESHSCHGAGNLTAITVEDSCPHCDISSPSDFQETRSFNFSIIGVNTTEGIGHLLSLSSTGGLSKLNLPPPRHKNPLYVINSIYII